MDLKTIDESILVAPGAKSGLSKRDTVCAHLFADKAEGAASLKADAQEIDALQDRLWAEGARALLVVLQGIDTSGKDGTVRGVFGKCGPLGVAVTPFGRPTEEELAHDYLWRIHAAAPRRGHIGVFNRSHYEDVLVVKVRKLAPAMAIEQRYEQINAFEKHLAENGTTILKFMLNISRDEQRERLQARQGMQALLVADRERSAMLAFLRRLLHTFGDRERAYGEGLLPKVSIQELDRLVGISLSVIGQEARGSQEPPR